MAFVSIFIEQEQRGPADAHETFEYRLDRRMRRAALAWASEHPRRVVELATIKLARMWNVWPNEASLRSWPLRLAVAATFVPLAALSLVGIWRFTPWGWPYVLAWLPAVYLTLIHVIFVGSIRYREPALLAAIVLAAGVLAGAAPKPAAAGVATQPS
jgi:hypothetical protein